MKYLLCLSTLLSCAALSAQQAVPAFGNVEDKGIVDPYHLYLLSSCEFEPAQSYVIYDIAAPTAKTADDNGCIAFSTKLMLGETFGDRELLFVDSETGQAQSRVFSDQFGKR